MPDLVFPGRRIAAFVHGCFWHRHAECPRATEPRSRVDYWRTKFERNVERDRRARERLEQLGWRVFTIWECEAHDPLALDRILRDISDAPTGARIHPLARG